MILWLGLDIDFDGVIALLSIFGMQRGETLAPRSFQPVIDVHAIRLALVNIFFVSVSLSSSCAQNLVNVVADPDQVRDPLLKEGATFIEVSLFVVKLLSQLNFILFK